jgi:hypothetical protein
LSAPLSAPSSTMTARSCIHDTGNFAAQFAIASNASALTSESLRPLRAGTWKE